MNYDWFKSNYTYQSLVLYRQGDSSLYFVQHVLCFLLDLMSDSDVYARLKKQYTTC
jgi:hypothetical protein